MIDLYQFPSSYGLPNISPFCMKLASYFRAMGIDYRSVETFDPRQSPTGKLPFIKESGEFKSDSGLIIQAFENKVDKPIDAILTPCEKATSLAFIRLVEEHLYWVIVYARWLDEQGYSTWKKDLSQSFNMPAFFANLIITGMRKTIQKYLHGHGIGRHQKQTIYEMGRQDLKALSDYLADRTYFFQDQPTLLDHVTYSFISSIQAMPWSYPLKTHLQNHANLLYHQSRMLELYFPEMVVNKSKTPGQSDVN